MRPIFLTALLIVALPATSFSVCTFEDLYEGNALLRENARFQETLRGISTGAIRPTLSALEEFDGQDVRVQRKDGSVITGRITTVGTHLGEPEIFVNTRYRLPVAQRIVPLSAVDIDSAVILKTATTAEREQAKEKLKDAAASGLLFSYVDMPSGKRVEGRVSHVNSDGNYFTFTKEGGTPERVISDLIDPTSIRIEPASVENVATKVATPHPHPFFEEQAELQAALRGLAEGKLDPRRDFRKFFGQTMWSKTGRGKILWMERNDGVVHMGIEVMGRAQMFKLSDIPLDTVYLLKTNSSEEVLKLDRKFKEAARSGKEIEFFDSGLEAEKVRGTVSNITSDFFTLTLENGKTERRSYLHVLPDSVELVP